ncbi:MAG TPA: diguanylate cyclase [Bryobacteraceae bacterium]|nr:diguanylate cyclase [Bryobacteraceae bacterium]
MLLRALIADDDPVSRRILARSLRGWEYEVLEVPDGAAAWETLTRSDPPRLAILDWMMPGLTGPEVCRLVRRCAAARYTYMLLLTARSKRMDLVEGMEAGADDYLIKPIDSQELQARLRAGRRILELESDLIAAREALHEQATRDPLTWVWNRYAILDILGRELERGMRQATPVSVVMADLDHFKRINDSYGHLAGDSVLREAARRMQDAVRVYDAVGRYGGEEFLLVFPGLELEGAVQLADRLRRVVCGSPVVTEAGPVGVTASLGMSTLAAGERRGAESLIEAADQALYRAKEAGRNRLECAYGRCGTLTGVG